MPEGCIFREGRKDVRVWNPNPSRGFTNKSLFSHLLDPFSYSESVFDVVCKAKVPMKVRFFIWQVLLGHVNTVNRLVRKRTLLVGLFCCMLCRKAEEDLDHFFCLSGTARLRGHRGAPSCRSLLSILLGGQVCAIIVKFGLWLDFMFP